MRFSLSLVVLLLFSGVAFAQPTYMGDQACAGCHANMPEPGFFDGYMASGHPWKLFRAGGNVPAPDTWPGTPVPPLPMVNGVQLQWSDIEYVIGNYFWKARFIDSFGYIYTGSLQDSTQWNIATQEFVPYHAGELNKPYNHNCRRCHTTGSIEDPNDPSGFGGTWAQDGVRCEACHGPASDHVASGGQTPPPGGKDCSDCHYRDSEFRMPWKSGFMRHHQQAEDLSHSPHAAMHCTKCHNPHRSVVFQDGGTITHCSDCHPGNRENNNYVVSGMESVNCVECHMPKMAKSATSENPYKADIHGHLFRIMTDPIAAADNVTDGFWNQDPSGESAITLDYACLGCHTEGMTLEEAAAFAETVHEPAASDTWLVKAPYGYLPGEFTVTFENFAGILFVDIAYPTGNSTGIGVELGGLVLWWDSTGSLFVGSIDRGGAGTMWGVAFRLSEVAVWFAESAP